MYDGASDTSAAARSSTLNEELGQVKYVLSDKTGTLTQNIMVLKQCSVNGRVYGQLKVDKFDGVPLVNDFKANKVCQRRRVCAHELWQSRITRHFLTAMTVCHTVVPERPDPGSGIVYQASSPDEEALVRGVRTTGYVFHTRTPDTVVINAVSNVHVDVCAHTDGLR